MFAKNIKYLRLNRQWRQVDLSKALGYSTWTTINKWESGSNTPPYKTIQKIARLFNVSENDLLSVDLEKRDEELRQGISRPTTDSVRINVYGTVPAGVPQEAIQDIVDWEDIPKEWTTGGREYFGLKVKGASMEPKYLAGDTIIVRKQSSCESGQDCVVYVNGFDATLKKVILNETHVILQAINPAYETKMYAKDDTETPVNIAGVVVEIRRTV